MSENDASTSSMVYVLIALEQDITTSELAVGAQNASMPEAQTEAPDWFAAAAEAVDVMAMAPELRQYPEGSSGGENLDIIGVYAPEMAGVRDNRSRSTAEMVEAAEDEESLISQVDEEAEGSTRGADEESEDPSSEVDPEGVEDSASPATRVASDDAERPPGRESSPSDRKPSQFDLLKELGSLSD